MKSTFHKAVELPAPFGSVEFLGLMEPVRETDDKIFFRHRLYFVNPFQQGGRLLVQQSAEWPMEKAWFPNGLPVLEEGA